MADPVTPPAGGNWYDPFTNLALKGLEAYTKVAEVKASQKPNNVTVYRTEDLDPATGKPYTVKPTGTVGVSTPSAVPAWLWPVALVGGGLVLVIVLVRGRR
jgi:hypothetical protein